MLSLAAPILAIARKEFEDHLRNGWILALALSFALFALVISYAGFGFTGTLSQGASAGSLVSLTSLVLYLIPLMGLLLGYDGIAGERAQGTLDLLASYPVDAWQIMTGKLFGLSGVLASTLAAGLTLPALLAMARGGTLAPWLSLLGLSIVLGAVFVGLALLLSTLARERATVLGAVLALWLVLVILFDLGLIGLLVATGGNLPPALIEGFLLLNPASLFRMLSFSALLGEAGMLEAGLGTGLMPGWSLFTALVAWTALPVALAAWRLGRME